MALSHNAFVWKYGSYLPYHPLPPPQSTNLHIFNSVLVAVDVLAVAAAVAATKDRHRPMSTCPIYYWCTVTDECHHLLGRPPTILAAFDWPHSYWHHHDSALSPFPVGCWSLFDVSLCSRMKSVIAVTPAHVLVKLANADSNASDPGDPAAAPVPPMRNTVKKIQFTNSSS